MATKNLKVRIKAFEGKCDTVCSECSTVRGVTDPDNTLDTTGILTGVIAEDSLGRTVWTEGCICYANFQFDDAQLAVGVLLKPCDVALVCGAVVDLIDKQALIATPCAGTRTCFSGVDTPTIDYTYDSVTGIHSAAVKISATAGNKIVANADGIFVPTTVVNPVIKASTIAKLEALGLTNAEANSLYDA
jgi:hypothetical protein